VTHHINRDFANFIAEMDELYELAPQIDNLNPNGLEIQLLHYTLRSMERVRETKFGDLYLATDEQKRAIIAGLNDDAFKFMDGTKWVLSKP